MKQGAIRRITWGKSLIGDDHPTGSKRDTTAPLARSTNLAFVSAPPPDGGATAAGLGTSLDLPRLEPPPASAEDETVALLRIAAEVEGALLSQYLFSAGSLLPAVSMDLPGFDHAVQTDDWYDVIRVIARQEMGHLITVQNLLLSLSATPHLDRENFPSISPLYPFPFTLQPVRLATIARYVCAEAPRNVAAADKTDYSDAVREAKIGDAEVTRAGQIYERLFYLFQDGNAPQEPWQDLQNPFPHWPNWHVDPGKIGFNQDRQATPSEWRGQAGDEPPDTAIYVLPVQDKASARHAVYALAVQGEGPVGRSRGYTFRQVSAHLS